MSSDVFFAWFASDFVSVVVVGVLGAEDRRPRADWVIPVWVRSLRGRRGRRFGR